MRLLQRSKLNCRPYTFGVQVRPAVLESLHAVASEKLLLEFWAAVLESLPRWASAKRRHLQERRVAQTNRWERPVGRRGVTHLPHRSHVVRPPEADRWASVSIFLAERGPSN